MKSTILIVDDTKFNRSILFDILNEDYNILEAENGLQAVNILEAKHQEIALVLLDIVMPEMDGFEVLTMMNKRRWIEEIPVITISSETSPIYVDHAYDLGATDYISRPFDEKTVKRRVQNTVMLYFKQNRLKEMVKQQFVEKEKNNIIMVEILSNIVEFRNGESGMHVLHIRALTEILLRKLTEINSIGGDVLQEIPIIVNASSLHDIGKISIKEEILNKPGKLTSEEYAIMKTHSAVGAGIIGKALDLYDEKLVKYAYNICRWHHERNDGRGYPDGLKGAEIPLEAQVVALADVYDALISERIYKPAYSHEQSVKMILNGDCGEFAPVLLDCLEKVAPSLEEELKIRSERRMSSAELNLTPGMIIDNNENLLSQI